MNLNVKRALAVVSTLLLWGMLFLLALLVILEDRTLVLYYVPVFVMGVMICSVMLLAAATRFLSNFISTGVMTAINSLLFFSFIGLGIYTVVEYAALWVAPRDSPEMLFYGIILSWLVSAVGLGFNGLWLTIRLFLTKA